MKRCPECRRDYYDDTLSFCLDDGSRLLDGPAADESATAILNGIELPSESPTVVLLAAGRSFAAGGVADQALLESYGAPIKWDIACTTASDAFEASFGQQDSAVGSRIAKNADLNDKFAQMIALKSTITHMVPNFCTGNPGAIAAWTSAAHVEAAPKAKPKPPTP